MFSFLSDYLDALYGTYLEAEREGYTSFGGRSILGFVFGGHIDTENLSPGVDVVNVCVGGRPLCVVKILYKNSEGNPFESIKGLKERLPVNSPFILLEQTGHWPVFEGDSKNASPSFTKEGNIYLSVGEISEYFLGDEESHFYKKDSRGRDYRNLNTGVTYPRLRDLYFSEFLDTGRYKDLVDKTFTGMRHLTSYIVPKNGKLSVGLVQYSGVNWVRFFESDSCVFLGSDECFLRAFRLLCYPTSQIKIPQRPFAQCFEFE